MIEPIIMNAAGIKLGVIDDYSSFIWTTRYYECGDFELVVPVDSSNIDLIQLNYFVLRNDDENAGIIEKIEMSVDEDQHEQIIATGRFLPSILERRIIATQTQLYGTVSAGITNLINDAIINPIISARKINGFRVIPTNFTERLEAQYTGKNLLEVIQDICQTNHIGFKTIFSENYQQILFTLYKGVDRSYNQSENPWVVFSDEYDNLLSSTYTEQYDGLVTDVLVAGEGEGLDRKTIWVSRETNTGLNRYELYHDQRNLSTNDGEISEEDYKEQMTEEGLEQLTTITRAFDGTVYFDNIKYKEDVNIGDIVVIENKRWGIHINSRLIEVIESVDESGVYSIVPTFGA